MRTPAAGVWRIVAGLLLLPCLVAGTAAADVAGTVVFNDRTKAQSGQIVAVSPLNVEVGEKKIPIERIADVEFDDEPSSMKAARRGVLRGEAAQAEEDLKKIGTSSRSSRRRSPGSRGCRRARPNSGWAKRPCATTWRSTGAAATMPSSCTN
jgi:hypothetical protein